MATAWEILKANSSLDSGTAWEHLINQNTGTGEGTVIVDGMEVEMAEVLFDIDIADVVEIDIEIEELTIEVPDLEVEV